MRRSIVLLGIFALAAPLVALAAEPAWWTQQKSKCGLSSSLAHNTWVSQGSPCNSGTTSSSSTSSGGSIGTIIGTEIGKELSKALFGDPETDARRKAEEELRAEEQRRAAEEANRKLEEQKNRLLGGMMGVNNSQPLGLMGIESDSELTLMTDSASAIAPSAKRAPTVAKKSTSYTKGFEHASQCISQNSASACVGVTTDQQQACVADYRGGYDSGSLQKNWFFRRHIRQGRVPPLGVNWPMLPRINAPKGPAAPTGS